MQYVLNCEDHRNDVQFIASCIFGCRNILGLKQVLVHACAGFSQILVYSRDIHCLNSLAIRLYHNCFPVTYCISYALKHMCLLNMCNIRAPKLLMFILWLFFILLVFFVCDYAFMFLLFWIFLFECWTGQICYMMGNDLDLKWYSNMKRFLCF